MGYFYGNLESGESGIVSSLTLRDAAVDFGFGWEYAVLSPINSTNSIDTGAGIWFLVEATISGGTLRVYVAANNISQAYTYTLQNYPTAIVQSISFLATALRL